MSDERRYDEDDVRKIFDRAASAAERGRREEGDAGSADGLTLPELQSIGREVGLSPERIAHAAAALDHREVEPPRRTLLGAPLTVGRTVALPRAPTDGEWEQLVAELRRTFGARGRVESYGSTREWSNGNLHARVEPSGTGHHLRLGTLKGSALAASRAGGFLITFGVVLLVVGLLTGGGAADLDASLLLSLLGSGMVGWSAVHLRSWSRERAKQMEHVADRARALLEEPGEA